MSRTHYLFGHKTEADEISLEEASLYFAPSYLDELRPFMQTPLDDILYVLNKQVA